MDPVEAWKDVMSSLNAGDFNTAFARVISLQQWRRRGGFAPAAGQRDPRDFDALLSFLRTMLSVDCGG